MKQSFWVVVLALAPVGLILGPSSYAKADSIVTDLPAATSASFAFDKDFPLRGWYFFAGEVIAGDFPGEQRNFVGAYEFNLRTVSPLPGMSTQLQLPDTGGKVLGYSSTNISTYAGTGIIQLSNALNPGSPFLQITRPVSGGTTSYDATSLIGQYKGNYLGLSFQPADHDSQDDFGSAGEIGGKIVATDDAMQVVKNGIKPETGFTIKGFFIPTPGKGTSISIEFKPTSSLGVPVSITALAAAFGDGIQYFTWVSKIVRVPCDLYILRENPDRTQTVLKAPLIDPDTVASNQNLLTVGSKRLKQEYQLHDRVNDNLDFYFRNDELSADTNRPFDDTPALPDGFYQANDYLEFSTSLVGVRSNGSYRDFGIGVDWKSNVTDSGSGQIYLSNPDGLPSGLSTSGQVFDVQVFGPSTPSVPEPATLTLLALGVAGLVGYTCRRRKQAAASPVC